MDATITLQSQYIIFENFLQYCTVRLDVWRIDEHGYVLLRQYYANLYAGQDIRIPRRVTQH